MYRRNIQYFAEWLLRRIGYVPILWHIDDVREIAEQDDVGFVPTEEECFQVLDNATDHHNAEHGIGWDDLSAELDQITLFASCQARPQVLYPAVILMR